MESVDANDIAVVFSETVVADVDMLAQTARQFFRDHPDQYDLLVMWGGPKLAPGHAYYWPLKNDVPGIGYKKDGIEFFDDSADFGSQRLQGVIWMGPDWIANEETGRGPRSVLGILAQETGHRWAATMRFKDPVTGSVSSALLEDSCHWNTYLHTGASPMGGNQWNPLGGSLFQAVPVDHVEYCDLDLYAMGLIPADQVAPVVLLTNAHTPGTGSTHAALTLYSRLLDPRIVEADATEVAIEQIIAAEGPRPPDVGFGATSIRQAWIYVHHEQEPSGLPGLERLVELQHEWDDFFQRATGGRSSMSTALR